MGGFRDLLSLVLGWKSSTVSSAITQVRKASYISRPVIESYDTNGRQYRLLSASGIRYSNHYSEEGSGYGYLSFVLNRKVGYNYNDIGIGYRVILRKGIRNILFDGVITQMEEGHGDQGDTITVNCVGYNSLLNFEIQNFILSDARLNHWIGSEDASSSFCPEKFDHNTSWDDGGTQIAGLQFKPRRNVDFETNDYVYLRYTFDFGETPARCTFDYDVALPGAWPGKLELRDDNANVLLSVTATGSDTEDITITGATEYIEFRFYVTSAGENTAVDGTVYGRVTDLTIYSTTDTVDAARVAEEIVGYMSTNFDFSNDTSRLVATGYTLPQAAFDTDQTLAEIMAWCVEFGGANYAPIAWGLEFNEQRRMFVELQDLTTIKYVVPRSAGVRATIGGDWGESAQKVYAIYQDELNNTQRTSISSDTTQITKLGGLYRKEAIQAGRVTQAQAEQAVAYRLSEVKKPKVSSSFSINGSIRTPSGAHVPLDEIKAGGIVELRDFRAREATLTPDDLRTGYTTFMLIGVEIDLDQNTATLIPAGDRSRYERYIATLSKMTQG